MYGIVCLGTIAYTHLGVYVVSFLGAERIVNMY
jgi:hypothetical protein